MAIQRKESAVSGTKTVGKKLFLSEYIEENPDIQGNNYEVTLVKETNSRNGYLLETKEFNVCIFKSSTLVDTLLELIEDVYSNLHCAVYVIIDQDEEEGIAIAYDLECKRTWLRQKKYPAGYRYSHVRAGGKSAKLPRNLSQK